MKFQYRLTSVTTIDYGDGPAAGKTTQGKLARIRDGSHWSLVPQTIDIRVPEGTRPGLIFTVSIEGDIDETKIHNTGC